MTNKEMVKKLKDYAELVWASYGYFHLANPNYDFEKDNKDKERLEYFRKIKKEEEKHITDQELQNTYPTHADILNIEHKYFKDKKTNKPKDGFFDDRFLGGDMTPTQIKNFLKKYDILIHQPNTESGFSATLFGKKRKQTNIES